MNVCVDVRLLLSNATSEVCAHATPTASLSATHPTNHMRPHLVRGRGAPRTSYVAAVWENWARSTSELDNPNLGADPNPRLGINPNLGLGSDARSWQV